MWIARDKNGALSLFENKPWRDNANEMWIAHLNDYGKPEEDIELYGETDEKYSYLTWKDEPVEVELYPKMDFLDDMDTNIYSAKSYFESPYNTMPQSCRLCSSGRCFLSGPKSCDKWSERETWMNDNYKKSKQGE